MSKEGVEQRIDAIEQFIPLIEAECKNMRQQTEVYDALSFEEKREFEKEVADFLGTLARLFGIVT